MPHKTFQCVICGQEITKPKSYACKGGRACRGHQEAKKARQVAIQQSECWKQKKKEKDQRRDRDRNLLDNLPKDPPRHCWICGREDGLTLQDAMLELAVDFRMDTHAAVMNMLKGNVSKEAQNRRTRVILSYKYRKGLTFYTAGEWQAAELLGEFQACGNCADKCKLELTDAIRKAFKHQQEAPKLDFKTLSLLGTIMEPVVRAGVQKRIEGN